MRVGLRTRVALAFGLLSLVVAVVVSTTTYVFVRYTLVSQRESASLTRAVLDARAVDAALQAGEEPGVGLQQAPSVGTSQALVQVAGSWYTRGVTIAPADLPAELLDLAVRDGGARQRFAVGDEPYFVVAVPVQRGVYVEVFPLRDLDRALTAAGWLLVALALAALLAGMLIGRYAGARLLRPLRLLADGARRVAAGDLAVRLPPTGDPDLDPIASSFNEMAGAVQSRISRERRFVANVSHELRSPLTTVVGTAELLDRRRTELPPRDAALTELLVRQARRLSRTVLDLLEISRIGDDAPVQQETADIAALVLEVLEARGLPADRLAGEHPLVRTDARRVERIVANLVDNAERHGGGLVRVEVRRRPGAVLLAVDDAGPGVDPADAERLFEPFTRGASAAGDDGAGLGLALVREQARVLGGTVEVSRSPEGGARFAVELPLDVP